MTKGCSVVFCLLALGVLTLGCGGSGEYGSPKATFDSMVKAAKAEDKDAMMACFTAENQADMKELEKLTEKMMEGKEGQEPRDMGAAYKKGVPVYGEEIITGDKATLEVTMEGQKQILNFVKESGDWKMFMPGMKEAVESIKMAQKMMEGMGENMGDMMKNIPGAGEGTKKK